MKLTSVIEINQNDINQVSGGNNIKEREMIERRKTECKKECDNPNSNDCIKTCNWAIVQIMHFRKIVGTMEKEMEEMRTE